MLPFAAGAFQFTLVHRQADAGAALSFSQSVRQSVFVLRETVVPVSCATHRDAGANEKSGAGQDRYDEQGHDFSSLLMGSAEIDGMFGFGCEPDDRR